jgi:DNA polymerase-3 subunit gamma/tau
LKKSNHSVSQFVVSARKYRPARFEDVVGQAHITQTLKNALRNGQLAHAFLFCGPRGVGKTTCARILAKVINCTQVSEDFEACNVCPSCKAFNENASFNIIELDAASNNSVENIRSLIDQVRFQPQQGKYKVFIIDEVHMLSTQAFNAFLKTLEEPPPYAIFILATTEKHKIIPTILSRCQIFDFKRIQVPEIAAHLEQICQRESIQADPQALHIIAQKADGALRDALSIFDRMATSAGKKIDYEHVIQNLNVLDYDYFFKITDFLLIEDLSSVLLTFDDILRKGFEPDLFLNGFAEHLRNLLVCKDPETLSLLEVGQALRQRYAHQAALTPVSLLLTALNLINECDVNYKLARNKRLHTELCLIKLVYVRRIVETTPFPPTSEEKKNPEPNPTLNHPPSPQIPPLHAVKTPDSLAPDPQNKEINGSLAEKAPADPPATSNPSIASAQQVWQTAAHLTATPRLDQIYSHNLDVTAKKTEDILPLHQENLTILWDAYVENIAQETTRNLLRGLQPVLEEEQINVQVTSALVENALKEERPLMATLRDRFGKQALTLNVTVKRNEGQSAVKIPKIAGNKEKLMNMYERNPAVKILAERFNLRFDGD